MFLLRCIEVGISLNDLDYMTHGDVIDILTESGNDHCEYSPIATQEDYDRW